MKKFLLFFLMALSFGIVYAQGGWKLVGYNFVDGTKTSDNVLAGTSDYMTDLVSFTGKKGNIQITKKRIDKSSGKLLAGVTYSVTWSDPQDYVAAGEKIRLHYTLKTISSTTWKPDQQMAKFSQGVYGINLANAAGEIYFNKDFSSEIISQKPLSKGAKDKEKKTLTVTLGSGFQAVYQYEWDASHSGSGMNETITNVSPSGNQPGWYFVKYEFVDGTKTSDNVLAGTSDYMTDLVSFTGKKGNIQITKKRIDKSSGKLLAGVTYTVTWSDPQDYVAAGEKIRLHYTLKTISSTTWKPDQQMAKFSQGIYGINLANAAGEIYFNKDFSSEIISQKPLVKGAKDKEKKTLTVTLGSGFQAIYHYEWRN